MVANIISGRCAMRVRFLLLCHLWIISEFSDLDVHVQRAYVPDGYLSECKDCEFCTPCGCEVSALMMCGAGLF